MEMTDSDRKIAQLAHRYKWAGNALFVFGALVVLGAGYVLTHRTVGEADRHLLFAIIAFGVGYIGAGSLIYSAYSWIERYRDAIRKTPPD